MIWFGMVVPMLNDVFIGAWIPNYENLLNHLKDSKFKKNYDMLEKSAGELKKILDAFISQSKAKDPQWGREWDAFDSYLGVSFVDCKAFQPDTITPNKTIDKIINNLPVSNIFVDNTVKQFRAYYPNLDKHCGQLEKLVQQVYDDLDDDIISADIEAGKCQECSSSD